MHLYQVGTYRIALILAIVTILCEISSASNQCKMVVMDVHMKRCRLGTRAKRSLEQLDLQKHDDHSKRQEGPDYSATKTQDLMPQAVPHKRQLSPKHVPNIAVPIVTEPINGAVKANEYFTPRTRYYIRSPGLIERTLSQSGRYQPASYPLGRGITPFRSSALSDDRGPDLNAEELDELYNNIYERTPRASKEEAWKAFLETASKCCQNVDKCLKEAMRVPCLAL